MYLEAWEQGGLFQTEATAIEEQLADHQKWWDRAIEPNRQLFRSGPDAQIRARQVSEYGGPSTVGRKWLKRFETLSSREEFPSCVTALVVWTRWISRL